MGKYRVLIVDDEPDIAEGIEYLIQNSGIGCEIVGLAFDGLEGINKAIELEPNIILTDIRMPLCDGLDMIEKIKSQKKYIKYIVLSGYAEFEYAKQAVKMGVEEYITKPIDEKELYEALRHVCIKLEEEREKQCYFQTMDKVAKEYIIRNFLNGTGIYGEESRRYMEQQGLNMNCKYYLCLVSEIYLGGTVPNFIQTWYQFMFSDKCYVIIGGYDKIISRKWMEYELEQFQKNLRSAEGDCAIIGIGNTYSSIEKIPDSFEEARCALNYKIMTEKNIIYYDRIEEINSDKIPVMVSADAIKELEECIDRMDESGTQEAIHGIFSELNKQKNWNMDDLKTLSLNLILSGLRKLSFSQFQLNQYLGKNIFSLDSISNFYTMEQLENWIINTLKSVYELRWKEGLAEKKDIVKEAREYIAENYTKDISMMELAEKFYVSPYYFSHLFKKKTGNTFQNYLTCMRIEKAKKLLEDTELKIYEICELSGYTNVNHFIKIFTKTVGMKPGEYRKKYLFDKSKH